MKIFNRFFGKEDPLVKRILEQYPDLEINDSQGKSTIKKSNEQPALGGPQESPPGLVHLPLPVHCRIIRIYAGRDREYDDDNLSGGCKELRDAIAALLGLKGDSKEDGITFSYSQEKGQEAKTIIELYEKE